MFATPTAYCVTPSRTPFSRLPERASTLFREVKRRSVRIKRSCSFQIRNTPGNSFKNLEVTVALNKYALNAKQNIIP